MNIILYSFSRNCPCSSGRFLLWTNYRRILGRFLGTENCRVCHCRNEAISSILNVFMFVDFHT